MLKRDTVGLSFKMKLILSFIFVSVLPILVVQSFTYYNSTNSMTKKIDQLVKFNLIQTAKNLDTTLLAYEDIGFQIFSDDNVNETVQKINLGSDYEEARFSSQLRGILSRYAYAKEGIRSVAVFTSNGKVICFDKMTGSNIDNLWSDVKDVTRLPLYKDTMAAERGTVMTTPTFMGQINGKDQYIFHIAQKLQGIQFGYTEDMGMIVVSMDEGVLYQASNMPINEQNPIDDFKSFNFITDVNANIVSFPVKSFIGSSVGNAKQSQLMEGKSIIMNRLRLDKNGWSLVNMTDKNDLFHEMYTMQRFSLLSGLFAIFGSILLILYVSGNLTKSIGKVVSAMKKAQMGKLNVQIIEESKDEISIIANSFNKMMNHINELMLETKAAIQKQKEAEIRALEAQINPHFLYNTLDSINWMAIEKDEHEISRMLKGLALILRYSISDSNKLVRLKDEIEWLKQYVYLQQNRFNYSFQCHIDVDENLLNFPLYKLLLQPIIENSIIHGFSTMKTTGQLHIRIFKGSGLFIQIEIDDNGSGMEGATIRRLLQGNKEGYESIGIHNVFERLRIYYGDEASWDIKSQLGVGTKVILLIPDRSIGGS